MAEEVNVLKLFNLAHLNVSSHTQQVVVTLQSTSVDSDNDRLGAPNPRAGSRTVLSGPGLTAGIKVLVWWTLTKATI
jgi:hypothetical protein